MNELLQNQVPRFPGLRKPTHIQQARRGFHPPEPLEGRYSG